MKISNLTNARYLIVAALASANLVLFQNCSNYSGRVALEGMKDNSSITDGVPSAIDTGGATINMGDSSINTGTTNGPQNNGTPTDNTVVMVNPNGTTSMMNGSAGGMNNGDNVIINLDDPNHINGEDIDPNSSAGNNNSGGGNNSTGTMGGSSGGHSSNGSNGTIAGITLLGDDDGEVAEGPVDNHGNEGSPSNLESGSLCSLHSMIDDNPASSQKVIVLTSDDANKSFSFGNDPGTSGKIYVVYTGKETLHLTSLNYKGGNITICGNIKIDSLSSNGKVKLIFAQALSAEVNGNLSTSKLELSGSMVSEIEVDKKAGIDVKKCHIDSSLNIISD